MEIAVGQVFKDKDKRMEGRHVKVVYVYYSGLRVGCAECLPDGTGVSERRRRFAVKTLHTKFQLVSPAAAHEERG